MTAGSPPADSPLLGRFIVESSESRSVGLTVEEVVSTLASAPLDPPRVFRIHRVMEGGRMELVGVAPEAFSRDSCYLWFRSTVAEARADYDTIVALADRVPPPCRIEVQLARARSLQPEHVVALICRSPCEEPVGQWLRACVPPPGGRMDAGMAALETYRASEPQVVKQSHLGAA